MSVDYRGFDCLFQSFVQSTHFRLVVALLLLLLLLLLLSLSRLSRLSLLCPQHHGHLDLVFLMLSPQSLPILGNFRFDVASLARGVAKLNKFRYCRAVIGVLDYLAIFRVVGLMTGTGASVVMTLWTHLCLQLYLCRRQE